MADSRLDAHRLAAMSDEDAVSALSAIRGMGRWTAEVYLLFGLAREDVFLAGDLALAAAWAPHRALAARLLWHHWRFRTGRPSMDDPLTPLVV